MNSEKGAREGRCYELAYQHILTQEECILIHAEVFSPKLKCMIGHALVETETGFIYEPVSELYFEKDWLYATYKIKELSRYTAREALMKALEEGTYGPWHELTVKGKKEVNVYTVVNFKTKKALKDAVASGQKVRVYQPNADPTGAEIPKDGKVALEGPHSPAPHSWYAEAVLKDGIVVKVR